MSPALAALDVSDDAETLYRRLLRSRTADLPAHATELGWGLDRAAGALQQLIALQLVRGTADRQLVVDNPRTALERLIDVEEARLEQQRRQLSQARGAIPAFAADHSAGQADREQVRRPPLERLSPRLAASVLESLLRSSTGPLRTCVVSLEDGLRTALRVTAPPDGSGPSDTPRSQRAIYPLAALDSATGRRLLRAGADAGELQRISHRPPSEFVVLGREAALASTSWGSVAADYVLVRDAMLVEAFTGVFDLAWAQALPLPGPGPLSQEGGREAQARAEDRRLLALLAGGMQDEAVARYLGCGLRTVRRRVAALMDDLGAESRLQLGVLAERRGLLADAAANAG